MTAIRLAILSLLVLSAGCDRVRVQLPTPAVPGSLPRVTPEPDPATAGIVTGSVNWLGERPEVPPLHVSKITPSGGDWVDLPNPNAPHFSADGGIVGAVVYLRGLDRNAGPPPQFTAVAVSATDDAITVRPGGRVGFVPVGGDVEFGSAVDSISGVRARGASFFTLMLPDRTTARRRLDRAGRIELTSPANVYWAVADLFVCEHPYYTRTDDRGRFRFESVPAGRFEAVCWLPHWDIASTERDPETGAVFRARYAPPAEVSVPVDLVPSGTAGVRIELSKSSFPPATAAKKP